MTNDPTNPNASEVSPKPPASQLYSGASPGTQRSTDGGRPGPLARRLNPRTDPKPEVQRCIAALLDRSTVSTYVDELSRILDREGFDLGNLWMIEHSGPKPPMACLLAIGAGSTAMVFVTGGEMPILGQSEGCNRLSVGPEAVWLSEHRAALLKQVVEDCRTSGGAATDAGTGTGTGIGGGGGRGMLLQTLIEPSQVGVRRSFDLAGFEHLAALGYFRKSLPKKRGMYPAFPPGIRLERVDRLPGSEQLLLAALESSYVDTLDCPALCGVRAVGDVLESHRSVGVYDPTLWWIVLADGQPAGCMLLSVCDNNGSVELVYLGLAPQVRGKGLARSLLLHGCNELAGRGQRTLACAVDLQNTPALGLYLSMGFERFATRDAMIKHVG